MGSSLEPRCAPQVRALPTPVPAALPQAPGQGRSSASPFGLPFLCPPLDPHSGRIPTLKRQTWGPGAPSLAPGGSETWAAGGEVRALSVGVGGSFVPAPPGQEQTILRPRFQSCVRLGFPAPQMTVFVPATVDSGLEQLWPLPRARACAGRIGLVGDGSALGADKARASRDPLSAVQQIPSTSVNIRGGGVLPVWVSPGWVFNVGSGIQTMGLSFPHPFGKHIKCLWARAHGLGSCQRVRAGYRDQ